MLAQNRINLYPAIVIGCCTLIAGCSSSSSDAPLDSDSVSADAMMVSMDTGAMMEMMPAEEMMENTMSSGSRLSSSISELDGTETILDIETGLIWVNDIRFCMAGVTRPEAATCGILADMAVASFTDWRLPNTEEMSELTLAVDADEDVTLNYINASCAVMTASDGWVFTENSSAPGVISMLEPGNAGVRCVSEGVQ